MKNAGYRHKARRFTGPVTADERDYLAFFDLHIHASERLNRPVVRMDLLDPEHLLLRLLSQIGLDHHRIIPDLLGHTLGYLHAMIKNNNAVRYPHNNFHIVLDKKYGLPKLP